MSSSFSCSCYFCIFPSSPSPAIIDIETETRAENICMTIVWDPMLICNNLITSSHPTHPNLLIIPPPPSLLNNDYLLQYNYIIPPGTTLAPSFELPQHVPLCNKYDSKESMTFISTMMMRTSKRKTTKSTIYLQPPPTQTVVVKIVGLTQSVHAPPSPLRPTPS